MKATLSCTMEVLGSKHVGVTVNVEADNREAITLTLLSLLAELVKRGYDQEVSNAINFIMKSSRGL